MFSDQWSDEISSGLRLSLIIQENRDHCMDRGGSDLVRKIFSLYSLVAGGRAFNRTEVLGERQFFPICFLRLNSAYFAARVYILLSFYFY